MSKGTRYSEAVWICLRELYEASPKSSIKAIREALSEMLGVDIPGETTVSRRIRAEGWEKTAKKQCNFSSKTLRKKMQQKYNDNNAEIAVNKAAEVDLRPSKNRRTAAPLQGITRVYNEKSFLNRKSAQVVLELRRDSYVLGQYQRKLFDDLIEVEFQLDNILEFFNSNPPGYEGLPFDQFIALINGKHNRIKASLGLVESLNISLEKRARVDFVLYGINPEDTRDSESENRIIDVEADKEYYAEQERLTIEQQQKVAERMALLQSGILEEQIRQEAMEKAKLHELEGIDTDEDEFDEIND